MDKTLLATNARRILEFALREEFGARVAVTAPGLFEPTRRAQQVLYRFKNEMNLKNILIRPDPDDGAKYLWLIRTDTGLIAQPQPLLGKNPPSKIEADL